MTEDERRTPESTEENGEKPIETDTQHSGDSSAEKFLLFGRWSTDDVQVQDVGLRRYISLKPMLIPHTSGRHANRKFHKSQVPIVERFVNKLLSGGNRREKKTRTGRNAGKKARAIGLVKRAFEMIEYRTGMNPIQVLVTAIENAAPAEETTRISYGGMAYPRSVDIGPQRRIDIALRYLVVGASRNTHNSAKSFEECIADELLLAYKGDLASFAVSRKDERERVARSAR
ncbi:MAG: 30S ribosomal protein S7 [Candidatus Thorarchaeota archaeon]